VQTTDDPATNPPPVAKPVDMDPMRISASLACPISIVLMKEKKTFGNSQESKFQGSSREGETLTGIP
jgi:hypothetical protein